MTTQKLAVNTVGARAVNDVPVWNGTEWVPSPPVASSSPWITAQDIDFTAEPNQNLGVDGVYTIGGVAGIKKENSANETAPMLLTNGTGLVITPAGGTDFTAFATRTGPLLWLPLSSLGMPDFEWDSSLRITTVMSAPAVAQYGFGVLGIDNDVGDATRFAIQAIKGFTDVPGYLVGADTITSIGVSSKNVAHADNAAIGQIVLETDAILSPVITVFGGTEGDTPSGCAPIVGIAHSGTTDFTTMALGATALGTFGILLGGMRGAAAVVVTLKRLIVEYRL